MNVPVSAPRPLPFWARMGLGTIVAAGVIWYTAFLCRYISPHAGGSDSSGYLNSAKILSAGKLLTRPRLLTGPSLPHFGDFSNVPLGFSLRKDGFMAPTYPTGYPLQLIATSAFGFELAPIILNVITALGSGVLMFFYSRKLGVNSCLSLAGTALLLICPLFLFS